MIYLEINAKFRGQLFLKNLDKNGYIATNEKKSCHWKDFFIDSST